MRSGWEDEGLRALRQILNRRNPSPSQASPGPLPLPMGYGMHGIDSLIGLYRKA
jgi:hypothetical protein